jgi:hypothetical protein
MVGIGKMPEMTGEGICSADETRHRKMMTVVRSTTASSNSSRNRGQREGEGGRGRRDIPLSALIS